MQPDKSASANASSEGGKISTASYPNSAANRNPASTSGPKTKGRWGLLGSKLKVMDNFICCNHLS
jgi:hypothetical protein